MGDYRRKMEITCDLMRYSRLFTFWGGKGDNKIVKLNGIISQCWKFKFLNRPKALLSFRTEGKNENTTLKMGTCGRSDYR